MLHDVAVGAFLEQPTRKHALPFVGGVVEHDQLHKSAGFLWPFPLSGAFTGAQADQRTADTDAFARFQRHVTDQTVAFVEQADDRHALCHWRNAFVEGILFFGDIGFGQRAHLCRCGWSLFGFPVARSQCQAERKQCSDGKARAHAQPHQLSGVHA